MALWRVLDITSGFATLAVKHPPHRLDTTKTTTTKWQLNRASRAGFPRLPNFCSNFLIFLQFIPRKWRFIQIPTGFVAERFVRSVATV